jgi:hypothetical protein
MYTGQLLKYYQEKEEASHVDSAYWIGLLDLGYPNALIRCAAIGIAEEVLNFGRTLLIHGTYYDVKASCVVQVYSTMWLSRFRKLYYCTTEEKCYYATEYGFEVDIDLKYGLVKTEKDFLDEIADLRSNATISEGAVLYLTLEGFRKMMEKNKYKSRKCLEVDLSSWSG